MSINENISISFDMLISSFTGNWQVIFSHDSWGDGQDQTQMIIMYYICWRLVQKNQLKYLHEYGDGIDVSVTFDYPFNEMEWYNLSITRDVEEKIISLYVNGSLVQEDYYSENPNGGESNYFLMGSLYQTLCYGEAEVVNLMEQ